MKAALSVLKALPNVRKIALLGDMLELGDASESGHRETGGVGRPMRVCPC